MTEVQYFLLFLSLALCTLAGYVAGHRHGAGDAFTLVGVHLKTMRDEFLG